MLPRTAKEFGYGNPEWRHDLATGIEVGVRYLDWTRDRFPDTLPLDERLWFSPASYNAGFGRVYDARRLARQMTRQPPLIRRGGDAWRFVVDRRSVGREPVGAVRERDELVHRPFHAFPTPGVS